MLRGHPVAGRLPAATLLIARARGRMAISKTSGKARPKRSTGTEEAGATGKMHEAACAWAGEWEAIIGVIGGVGQPGVEFGSHNVGDYDSSKARALSATLKNLPGLVFDDLFEEVLDLTPVEVRAGG